MLERQRQRVVNQQVHFVFDRLAGRQHDHGQQHDIAGLDAQLARAVGDDAQPRLVARPGMQAGIRELDPLAERAGEQGLLIRAGMVKAPIDGTIGQMRLPGGVAGVI